MLTNCEFLEPLYFDPSTDTLIPLDGGVLKTTSWNYSKMICETEEIISVPGEIISDGENSFNLSPTFSYAEIVIIFFLIVFLALKIFSGIWDFVHTIIIRQKWLR